MTALSESISFYQTDEKREIKATKAQPKTSTVFIVQHKTIRYKPKQGCINSEDNSTKVKGVMNKEV